MKVCACKLLTSWAQSRTSGHRSGPVEHRCSHCLRQLASRIRRSVSSLEPHCPNQTKKPCASETVSRLAVQLGSFKEAHDALALLGCGRMSVSKVRDESRSRQLRVMNFFEYCNVDGKGTPVPIRGSFSYAVTDGEIAETTGLLKVQAALRSMRTAAMDAYFFNELKSHPCQTDHL